MTNNPNDNQVQNCYEPYPFSPKPYDYIPITTSEYIISNQKTDFEKLIALLDSIKSEYDVSEQKMNWNNLIFTNVKVLTICNTNFLFDSSEKLLGICKDSYEE